MKERTGKLLDATILNYCESMNVVDEATVCDVMFDHLLAGDLDNAFLSPKLADASSEDRERAFDIARKYGYLCFYEGNAHYWEDSVEGMNPIVPAELIADRILSNYNFLVELAYEKGEEAVQEITNFVGSEMAEESAVVDYLRNTFGNDKALKECLDATAKEPLYKDLSSQRKSILYMYPQGVLYSEEDYDDVMLVSKEQLFDELASEMFDNKINHMKNLNEVVDYLGDNYFASAIRNIYLNYTDIKNHSVSKSHK